MTNRASNRGPAAAAANRAALLVAARDLLAERGYQVPLSAIAKQAGVSQGVMYRHFPSRIDLALAVFEQNFGELEQLADDQDPEAFTRLVDRVLALTVDSLGFIEMVVGSRADLDSLDGERRLTDLVARPLVRAQHAGLVGASVTPFDVELGLQMVYGAAVMARDEQQRRDRVALVRQILAEHWHEQPRPAR
ncbi:TetR family transcriptional regulator [Propionibacteriaceae bacterium Y1923]|uniref:TetR family transcriptional regulator n=1 Tax=Aestuariimicrobium sp. Y1814 TaxID=3418742 RepID=UPI003C1A342C